MPSPTEIREARHRAGLTQSQAAALVGVSLRSWQYWEDGGRKMQSSKWELFLIKSKTIDTAATQITICPSGGFMDDSVAISSQRS